MYSLIVTLAFQQQGPRLVWSWHLINHHLNSKQSPVFHLHEEGKLDPVLYKLQNKVQV